ncbi:MAG: hypothetical protein U9Q12_03180 [Patescibacteria group bacterium]|nr:hypothetical protein [Patescibacteria group bacterium]
MQKLKNIVKNPMTYKLLVDIFLLLLLVVLGFIFFETLLPGIITPYISPFTLFTTLFIFVGFISLVAHKLNASSPITTHKKIIGFIAAIFFALLIGIAGFRYGFFFDSIIVIFSLVTFVLLHSLVRDMMHD